ncbi:hypothetical protein JTB14_022713 [Gonioctena quinquepunctata]|nr:hypothetical protein JTB14_022713 [Gonioctena quinquepunctata]
MYRHCPCENSLRNRPESDTGATISFASEVVENCCIRLGLEPSRQTGTQPRQADGTFCTTTQAFSPQMTVGQERLVHELLSPHLTVDIILGMDILTNKFRIDLASNTVFLNGRDVSCKETQPLMYLHVPEEIVEPIPSESFSRNDVDTAKPVRPWRKPLPGVQKEDQPRKQISKALNSNLVLLKRKTCLSTQTSREKPGSARDMPRHIPLNSVSRMHSQSHGTRMNDRTDLRHKLATQITESTKMVNHSTQRFEGPFEKNGYFHWKEVDSQRQGPLLAMRTPWSPATILSPTLEDILLPLWTMWSSFSGLYLWPIAFEAPEGCSSPSLLDPVVTGKVARNCSGYLSKSTSETCFTNGTVVV